MDRLIEAMNRIADAGYAIADAMQPEGEEDDETPDPPARGQGMGMG